MVNKKNQVRLFGKAYTTVSEAEQKDMSNTLYLYVETINGIVYLKFGEAFKQSIWDRYNQTGCTQHSKIIKVWSSELRDKYIHNVLKNTFVWAGNNNPLNTTEAYIVNSKEELNAFISTIDDIVASKKIGPDFYRDRLCKSPLIPRKYQNDIIESAKKILDKHNRILINLSTRAGKSFISLKLCKDLGAKNILILTPFPAAEDSFKLLGRDNLEFKGYKYIHLTAKTAKNEFCDKNIIFCSYQFYDTDKAIIKDVISDIEFDFIILDECHHTSDSERTTSQILSSVQYKKLIYMSGTPFNDIYSGYFKKDETVTFDFIDFIKYAKSNSNEVKLPELNIKNVCNLKTLQGYLTDQDPDIFNKADAFDFDIIFSDEQHAESFFKWLLQPVENQGLIISKKRWFDLCNQKNIIAFFSTTKQASVAAKALKKYYNGKVVLISGADADKDLSHADEDKINNLFNKNDRTIVLTCGKLTTGVTIPKLDTVWYFKKSSSAEQFVQILFRTMTPCEGKDSVSMYCFDTEASLRVIKEYATIRLDEKSSSVTRDADSDTFNSIINEIFSCINFVYLNDKFEFVSEKAEDYFEKIHNLPYNFSVTNALTNFHAFDGVSDLGTDCITEKDLVVSKAQDAAIRRQCERNNSLRKLLFLKKLNSKGNKCDDHQSEKVVKQILKILVNIDKKILVNNNIKVYTDLECLWPKDDKLTQYKSNFIQLLKDNKVRLNQLIEDVRYKQAHNLSELLNSLSFSNQTDMKTPTAILEKMVSKLNGANGIICDPCCGIGTIFDYIRTQYDVPKDNFYGIELEEDNVAICKLLGYKNVIKGDASERKTWDELVNLMNRNTNKMKFDHIIMNPPYCRNLHLKILNEAIRHSDDIVNLSPIRWLQDPLAEYKRNSDFKRFKEIRERIESIEIISASKAQREFSIEIFSDLGVYHLDKDGGFDTSSFWKLVRTPAQNMMLTKLISLNDTIAHHYEKNKRDGIRVPMTDIGGNRGYRNVYKELVYVIDGQKNGIDWTKCKNMGGYEKPEGCPLPLSIKFNTTTEAQNFYDSFFTKFYTWLCNITKMQQNLTPILLPWLGDYTHPWTDEDLYKYFNLSDDEIKIIESEIK